MKPLFILLAIVGIAFAGTPIKMIKNLINEKPTVVIMLGPPGAGKGTQAVDLSKKFDLPHISTGDLFRENMRNQTELGKKVKSFMDNGQLVPDQIVVDMLFDHLNKKGYTKGYILDGFPRTIPQAEILKKELKNANVIVINLQINDDLLVERITGRLMCKSCGAPYHKKFMPSQKENICDRCQGELYQRKDDTEELVRERLKAYHAETEPLIAFYKGFSHFHNIDSKKDKNEVFSEIVKIIDSETVKKD